MKRKTFAALLLLVCILAADASALSLFGKAPEKEEGVDLDLSKLSGTVVYSQVYNMMVPPQDYVGKTIRISGLYDVYEDAGTGNTYFACVIPDATACCAQGIEFLWAGEHTYPDDYPEPGCEMTMTGRFETYEEDGAEYIRLADAEVEWGEID